MWKEEVTAQFKVLFQHLPGGMEDTAVRIVVIPAEIRTEHSFCFLLQLITIYQLRRS
jgi:hypothetical protein